MTRVVETFYGRERTRPFNVTVYCSDGSRYDGGAKDRAMQARCAGWTASWREYWEDGSMFTERTWTGKESVAIVVTDGDRVEGC